MSILIKGMEMPESGTYEVSIDSTNGKDKTVMSLFVRGEGGVICCGAYELVHVPPHGDLIDRDAARETIKPWSPEDERNGCTIDTAKKLMHTMLARAPTVIPAEGKK